MVKSRKSGFSSLSGSSKNKSSLNSNKCNNNKNQSIRKEPTFEIKEKEEHDEDDYNSGFGKYLRSPEGSQMLILFVIANSAMIILTSAWPNIKELFRLIKETLFEEE